MDVEHKLWWFRRLALVGSLLAAAVVVLGGWVRLTDAGLGCPDWPGCYGHWYPQVDSGFSKALHEMIHRYFASTLGLVILSLLLWAFINRKDSGQPLLASAFLFVLVCLQGALGRWTVTLLVKPLVVTAHLLGGLCTLAILWWLALTPERRAATPRDASLRKVALVGCGVLLLQIFLGGWTSTNYAAVACPDLPTCQQAWWPPMDFKNAFILWRGLDIDFTGGILSNPARTAIQVTHRLGALIAGSILLWVGISCAAGAGSRRLKAAGLLLICALLAQIAIGLCMVYFGMPLPLATLHNAGAALLVICMVTVLRSLWPERAAGMLPLRHVDHA